MPALPQQSALSSISISRTPGIDRKSRLRSAGDALRVREMAGVLIRNRCIHGAHGSAEVDRVETSVTSRTRAENAPHAAPSLRPRRRDRDTL